MKKKPRIVSVLRCLVFIFLVFVVSSHTFSDEPNDKYDTQVKVKTHFLLLACENCLHMEVIAVDTEKFQDFVGKLIVPYSDEINVTDYIYSHHALPQKPFCLTGYLHRQETDFFFLQPKAYKFLVSSMEYDVPCF